MSVDSSELAKTLHGTRTLKALSLRAVADPAGISPTYLQKLERGEVQDPSPHILYRLSEELGLDYGELMQMAGYVVPVGAQHRALTGEEETALTEYLGFLRSKSGGVVETGRRVLPGFHWRVLAHRRSDGYRFGLQHEVRGGDLEFDELVLGYGRFKGGLHLEQMSDRHWWFGIDSGDQHLSCDITFDADGSVHFRIEDEASGNIIESPASVRSSQESDQ